MASSRNQGQSGIKSRDAPVSVHPASQLSEFNIVAGRERNVYVHAASKKRLLQMYLVAVTADEHDSELRDNNLKGEWRKQIPQEWLKL